jgi:transcriptional regulator with XRE-family HTH domain
MRRFSGTKLRQRRQAAGLSARELAEAISWSMWVIYDVEHGLRELRVSTFLRMVEVLGCEMEDLLEDVPSSVVGDDNLPGGGRDKPSSSHPQVGATL